MNLIAIYRWKSYDISTDEVRISRRYGTREAIQRVNGTILEETGIQVDAALLGTEIEGMSARDFNPGIVIGTQSQVTA